MANTPNYSLLKPDRTDNINDVDTSLANNFTIIDTEIKNRKDEIDDHIAGTNGQHTSEAILHADGSVKATLDNHEERLGNAETELTDHEGRLTDIETLGIDKLAPDLEGRLSTVENDVEGFLAPATMDGMSQQGYTFDEYRIGYVDNKLAPINEQLADIATDIEKFPLQIPETDDSARFTRALNSLPSNGGKIIFPHGKTYTGTFLINKANIRISGGGTLKGIIQLYGTDTTGISRFDPSATGDIYIDGITIDGEKTRNGITCKWVFGVTITNVTFKHCVKSINFEPIAQTQHCSRFTIANNRFWDCNYGLYVDWDSALSTNSPTMPYGVGDITYSNNVHESRNSGWDGTFGNIYHIWAKGLDGLVCKGNTFFFAGLASEISNIYLELFNWVQFEGNQLFVPPNHAIHAYNGSNLIIKGNNVAWSGKEAIFLDTVTTFVVDSNNLVWKDDNSVLANKTGVLVQNSAFAIGNISNNSMYFPNEYAVHIINSSFVNITGNMSRNKYATGSAVQLDTLSNCNDIIISGNNFTNYPTTVHSAISTRQTQQRIFYMGNNEGVSSFLSDGVMLQTRITTISASQTSLDGGNFDQFNLNNASAHTVSSLTNGYEGKEILFVAFNGNTTISSSAANLKGAVNVTLANKNTMKLKYTAGAWYEIARNF